MTFARLFYAKPRHSASTLTSSSSSSSSITKQKSSQRHRVSFRKKFKSTPRTKQDPIHYHNRKLAELHAKGECELSFILATAVALNDYMSASTEQDRNRSSEIYFEKANIDVVKDSLADSKSDSKVSLQCAECKFSYHEDEVFDICLECGAQINQRPQILIGYNERKDYITSEGFNYDEIKSVNELLREIQGLQKANIPSEICDEMKLVFSHYVAQCNRTLQDMTAADLFTCLKQEKKYSNYYRYIPTLLSRFTGRTKRTLSSSSMMEIQTLAGQVVSVYKEAKAKICPTRRAFFNTRYLTYRLLEKVGEDHLLPFIRHIKCPKKYKVQDELWDEVMRLIAAKGM